MNRSFHEFRLPDTLAIFCEHAVSDEETHLTYEVVLAREGIDDLSKLPLIADHINRVYTATVFVSG